MVIKFLCPNGHQLNAPENMAGKKGKCPKCQSAFVVPTMEEVAAAEAESAPQSDQSNSEASEQESPTIPAAGSGKGLPGSDLFVFLCPNGHRLNGPPSLKGKPGQCPHCGARFRIPTDDEEEPPEEEIEPQGEERPLQVVIGALLLFRRTITDAVASLLLLFFIFTTYLPAPVFGFGFTLAILGFALVKERSQSLSVAYLISMAAVLFYQVPWRDWALGT